MYYLQLIYVIQFYHDLNISCTSQLTVFIYLIYYVFQHLLIWAYSFSPLNILKVILILILKFMN